MSYSPILAGATAAFEMGVAIWALRGPGERRILRITAAILLLLAAYQVVEVAVCSDVPGAGFLPRLAFIVVTWLPPLGLVLIAALHRPRSRVLRGSSIAMLAAGAGIAAWIALDPAFAKASVCNAVYARYSHAMPRFLVYSWFYWIGLLGMIVFSAYGARACADSGRRSQLALVLYGTLGFIVPSVVVSTFVPPARGALPSIMCHFAAVLAVSLWRLVLRENEAAQRAGDTVARRHPASET